MDRGDFYSGGALIERVHQFEKLGLIKYCVLINRHVVTAFETCNGIIEIAGSCVFSRVILQRISRNTLRVWYDRFANMDHRSRDLDYNINSVARLIEDVMKQTRGKMTIHAPGRDTMVYHYNEIGWIIVILSQNIFAITTNMDGFVNIIERNTAYQSNADQEASLAKRIEAFEYTTTPTNGEQPTKFSAAYFAKKRADELAERKEACIKRAYDSSTTYWCDPNQMKFEVFTLREHVRNQKHRIEEVEGEVQGQIYLKKKYEQHNNESLGRVVDLEGDIAKLLEITTAQQAKINELEYEVV